MTIKDGLKPHENPRVMDLVSAAGVDVTAWGRSEKGAVAVPASNPAYCYEWAHVEPGRLVVLNLWHEQLVERDGAVFGELNPREWARAIQKVPGLKSGLSNARRAKRMDEAIAYAFENQLPIRVIVGDGRRLDLSAEKLETSPRMERRLLDPEPWAVERYDTATGAARLTRGIPPRFTDQFSALEGPLPQRRREVSGEVWVRDPSVRLAALRRAKGNCELCQRPGFRTASGEIYLETHHVIPLSEEGEDCERNVVAICPNDHREAHFGESRVSMREKLKTYLNEHSRK